MEYKVIGGNDWRFSDHIFFNLTGKNISSEYNPIILAKIKKIPEKIANKNIYVLCWDYPTFKDVDSNYIFHVHDRNKVDYIISTSSGNTVEGVARAIKKYNHEKNKNLKAILLVPELSSFKVARNVIENNPHVIYVVLKNSTLDSIRAFATDLIKKMSSKYSVVCANADMKSAAYSQIGLLLNHYNLMNENTCYVQTVSGGVGPTGFIEASNELNVKPEILVIQPVNGNSAPIIDALDEHSRGNDPILTIEQGNYETSRIETTLGSTKPIYAIKKYKKWREEGGQINGTRITENDLSNYRESVLRILIELGIYPNVDLGLKFFELEKSGFIAFAGTFKSIDKIKSENIVINFTGRFMDSTSSIPKTAKPHVLFDPLKGIDEFLKVLNLD